MRVKLGEICEIVSGSTPKTGIPEYWDGAEKWITPAELNEDTYTITDSVRKLTTLGVKKTGLSPFPEGTVILSSRAPIGKVAIAGCEMYCNQGFKNLICSQKIYNRYLYWFLKGNTEYLNSLGRGATFKEISKQIVASIEINVPDMEQQMQAAENLERVSSIIRLRKKELQKLDDLIKARFVELFGDSEFNTMQWPTTELSELCNVGSSKRIYQSEQCAEGVPFLRISDLNERIDNVKNVPELFIPTTKYNELKEADLVPTAGDILLTSRGTLGRCYIVRQEDEFYFQDGMISWLSDLNNQITSVYLSQLFAMSGIQKQITSLQAGSTVAYLSISMLKKLNIMLPPLDRQKQFSAFVQQTDKSKAVIQKALDEAQLLFDSLMQKYFG